MYGEPLDSDILNGPEARGAVSPVDQLAISYSDLLTAHGFEGLEVWAVHRPRTHMGRLNDNPLGRETYEVRIRSRGHTSRDDAELLQMQLIRDLKTINEHIRDGFVYSLRWVYLPLFGSSDLCRDPDAPGTFKVLVHVDVVAKEIGE